MTIERIPLTRMQKEIMHEFYGIAPTKVLLNKSERNGLWRLATRRITNVSMRYLKGICPALEHQIRRSYEQGNNIQSAVFSECVYAQTFANMLKLDLFVNCYEEPEFIPLPVVNLIRSYNLVPRYAYSTRDKCRMLIQAGGCNGIDSALISVSDLNIYTIEFKEPSAKTSEPDLPKYGEDGTMVINDHFLKRYPQFEAMLNEHRGLNFFDIMGHNVNDFSQESVNIAVSNNYTKKFADVICTEDIDGVLVMLPVNQVQLWAKIVGEIRPSGRNHYKVWTPVALRRFLFQYGADINGTTVRIEKCRLETRRERGGNGRISGYKLTQLFFVFAKDCEDDGRYITFNLMKVRQLKPTIAGKMFFETLKHEDVVSYYQDFL